MGKDGRNAGIGYLAGGPVFYLLDDNEAGLVFDKGDNAVVAVLADDRIGLPMPDGSPLLDFLGPSRNMTLAGQNTPGIMGIIAFTASLGHDSEVFVQGTAMLLVMKNVFVDCLVAHGERARFPKDV